jgi:hypothetical protein
MINCFKAIIIAKSIGLLSKSHTNPVDLMTCIVNNNTKTIRMFQRLGHSFFESMMLAWSTTTGQMNSHCAIHAHADGNLSHEIETMTLFGRTDPNESNVRGTSGDSDFKFKSGSLVFPLDDFVVKLSCAKMNMHCNLKNILHVPDNTRNLHNWSKVHGPKF